RYRTRQRVELFAEPVDYVVGWAERRRGDEVRRVVDAPMTGVLSTGRVRKHGPGANKRVVRVALVGDDPVRCVSRLHPIHECRKWIERTSRSAIAAKKSAVE